MRVVEGEFAPAGVEQSVSWKQVTTPVAASAAEQKFQRGLAIATSCLMFAVPLFSLIMALHQLRGGWDDGAITASFSRTFAESGRIALTPVSEQVEGFSSVSWFLLLAIPRYLTANATAMLVWMKLLAAVAMLLSLFEVRRLGQRLCATAEQANAAVILMALVVSPVFETMNGMEMNFYMLLVLCLVDVLTDATRNPLWVWPLSAAMIATRFEAPFLIGVLVAGLLLAQEKKLAKHVSIASGVSFATLEIWRRVKFGAWMPNTVYAKMHFPYTPHDLAGMLWTRVLAVDEVLQVLGGPLLLLLLVAGCAVLLRRVRIPQFAPRTQVIVSAVAVIASVWLAWLALPYTGRMVLHRGTTWLTLLVAAGIVSAIVRLWVMDVAVRELELFTALFTAAALLFGILFGRNWGYSGRMILPCIPFLVLAAALWIDRLVPSTHWQRTAVAALIVSQALAFAIAMPSVWKHGSGTAVSMSGIEKSGRSADAVRQLAGMNAISVLLPDVGGSSFCCERLEILDSALLSNSFLARHGYGAFDDYFQAHQPELVETHGMWTSLTGVYRNHLIDGYSLAVVDDSRLLIRNDVYAKVVNRIQSTTGMGEKFGQDCFVGLDPFYDPSEDMKFILSRGSCLYVSPDDLIRNGIRSK